MLNKHLIGGVGIIFAEQWIDKTLSVVKVNHQIIALKITLSILCFCAPQYGRPCEEKDDFCLVLLSNIFTFSPDYALIVCRDLNGHIGKDSDGFKGIDGGYGYCIRNADGKRVLDMCPKQTL